jgi:hypothetical protein
VSDAPIELALFWFFADFAATAIDTIIAKPGIAINSRFGNFAGLSSGCYQL